MKPPIRYLSLCSGIEAATVAWRGLGWEAVAFAEVEPFCCALLKFYYPEVPNLGDIMQIDGRQYEGAVDLIVGGTPCQSFSVAGKRKGLDDHRGNLTFEYIRLADEARPRWFVWENVPGVLSLDEGRTFGAILGAMAERGYGVAYRVLDAQHFGVPQRRRRVFVVGCLGDWRPAAEVLFERDSLRRDTAPCREAGEGLAGTVKGGSGIRGYPDPSDGNGGGGQDSRLTECGDTAPTVNQKYGTGGNNTPLVAAPIVARTGKGGFTDPVNDNILAFDTTQMASDKNYSRPKPGDPCHPLAAGAEPPAIAFHFRQDPVCSEVSQPLGSQPTGDMAVLGDRRPGRSTLRGGRCTELYSNTAVRRLTPRECERLQGFPDDHTVIPYRGKPAADAPRYRALGNSMAVPVMRWLGERIRMVEDMI